METPCFKLTAQPKEVLTDWRLPRARAAHDAAVLYTMPIRFSLKAELGTSNASSVGLAIGPWIPELPAMDLTTKFIATFATERDLD